MFVLRMAVPAAAIIGIALVQRIREMEKGEAEDAKRY